MTRRLLVVGAALVAVLVGVAASWALAHPAGPEPSAWADGASLACASLLLGLGALGWIDAEPAPTAVIATASAWTVAALIAAWLQVAQRAGIDVLAVGVDDVRRGLDSGLPILACALAGLGVVAWTVWTRRTGGDVGFEVAAVAAAGVLVTSITGHAGISSWTPIVIGVHALAAAWWIGTLGALAVSVRGRGGWARSLPEFSRRALPVVGVLTATGLIAAIAQIDVGPQWWDGGYGRILIAKLVLLAVAVGVARWHRTTWLDRARRHGVDETTSIRNAGIELVLLSVVLGLAAGLATTG